MGIILLISVQSHLFQILVGNALQLCLVLDPFQLQRGPDILFDSLPRKKLIIILKHHDALG